MKRQKLIRLLPIVVAVIIIIFAVSERRKNGDVPVLSAAPTAELMTLPPETALPDSAETPAAAEEALSQETSESTDSTGSTRARPSRGGSSSRRR